MSEVKRLTPLTEEVEKGVKRRKIRQPQRGEGRMEWNSGESQGPSAQKGVSE